jgi:hypothetical protein
MYIAIILTEKGSEYDAIQYDGMKRRVEVRVKEETAVNEVAVKKQQELYFISKVELRL